MAQVSSWNNMEGLLNVRLFDMKYGSTFKEAGNAQRN